MGVEGAILGMRRPGMPFGGRPAIGTAALSLSDANAARIEAEACRPPSDVAVPVTHWSAAILADHVRAQGIEVSDRTVARILHDADLQPHRQKMYLTSQDEEFRAKRDDVLRVYYETPADEHIVCVDEKTGMQALERRYPDIAMRPGQPVRREFEYIRHGTLCWMGALDVRRGLPFGFTSGEHNGDTFVDLLELIELVYPDGRGHIVMDNLSAHDTPDVNDWFDEHPRWTRHFTPKHASWLNQIECWFSILGRRVLARGSFASTGELANKINDYVLWHLQTDQPFHWTYRPKSWRIAGRTSGRRN
jgi:transposase